MSTFIDACYVGFLNMEHRIDRLNHMTSELNRVGISATRHRGKRPQECDVDKYPAMLNRTPGAIPCFLGQLEIMEKAMELKRHAFILEDDVVICSDINKRLEYIKAFLEEKDWSVFWLGGTYHKDHPYWHSEPHNKLLPDCKCGLGRDFDYTDDLKIVRTYAAFSTHSYVVNYRYLEQIIKALKASIATSIGVDFSFIRLQPQLNTFAFVPGCVKQMDNLSDIGTGMTYFSRFNKLGSHWFADKMEDYVEIKHRIELVGLLKKWNTTGAIVECGVAEGLFSKDLLDAGAEFLYCVDNWGTIPNTKGDGNFPQEWHDANYNAALDRVKDYKNVSLLRMMSQEASRQFPDNSLAMVYHDADHSYKGVREDIVGWWPKVKPGGIMAFHDYMMEQEYGVRKAVEEMFPDAQYNFILEEDIRNSGCWIRKPL